MYKPALTFSWVQSVKLIYLICFLKRSSSIIITLHSPFSSSLFFIFVLFCFSSHHLSSLCSVLLFSFLFTLPCSASMLPWQRSYRKSLLPRPHERSSFHRRHRDGEIEGERAGVFNSDCAGGVILPFSSGRYTPPPTENQQVAHSA